MPLSQGSPAISFQLPATTGEISLGRVWGKPFLLSFFSMAFTPVWTDQLVLLRQRHKDLQGLGVQVIGISADHLPSLKVFDAAMAEFPFPLASDWHRSICRSYGVFDEEKDVARRTLILCDSQAVVRHVVADFTPHQRDRFEELLATARTLA